MTPPWWAGLEIRHLVTLGEIVRTGSFTAAAESLGYTQSAVSQQVTRLEKTVGHRVVHRSVGGRAVSLTPAGRVLTGHAQALTATLGRLAVDLTALADGSAGVLRVGCFESVGAGLLPAAITRFAEAFPQVRVVVEELPDDGDLLGLVEQGDLDLTFVVFPLPEGPFRVTSLVEDPYVLVVAAATPGLPERGAVDLDDHPDLPLMAYARMRPAHAMEARLGRPGYRDRVVFRSHHTSTLLGLAAQGYAAAVVPWLGVDPAPDGVRVLGLTGVDPRVLGLAWLDARPLDAAARGHAEAARAVAGERGPHPPDGRGDPPHPQAQQVSGRPPL